MREIVMEPAPRTARMVYGMIAVVTILLTAGGAQENGGWQRAAIVLFGGLVSAVSATASTRGRRVALRIDDHDLHYSGWFRTLQVPLSALTMIGWMVVPPMGYHIGTGYMLVFRVRGRRLPYLSGSARSVADRLGTSQHVVMRQVELAATDHEVRYRGPIPDISPSLYGWILVFAAAGLPIGAVVIYYAVAR